MSGIRITRDQAKARARALRAELAAKHGDISHAAALERVARELGFTDWNTMSARLPVALEPPLRPGDRVEGRYLNIAFSGSIVGVRIVKGDAAVSVTIAFDMPIDVVTFDSFSAYRRRVTATISASGVSFAKTSDGVPHLIVGPIAGSVS